MKKFVKEFKEFIARGNVLDMAIGVILATSFGTITSTLVSNVLTPLFAAIFNAPNTDALNITLRAAELAEDGTVAKEALVLGLGTLIGAIIDFLFIAFVVFLIIKAMNKARAAAEAKKKAEEEAKPEEPAGPTTEELLQKILDELQKKK